MESKQHPLTLASLRTSPSCQTNPSGLEGVSSRQRLLRNTALAGIIGFTTLFPVVAGAAPFSNANETSVNLNLDDKLPDIARAKRAGSEEWARGRILIMPRAGLPAKALNEILKEHDGKARKIGQSDLYIVDLPAYTEEGVITRLRHNPHLKFAELDRAVPPTLVPNDPHYVDAWHLPKINAPLAWEIAQGAGITIAILDSGIDSAHPDLATKIMPGWNFFDGNSNTTDVYGHGTSVAGAAAALTNNNIGVAGLASQSGIMPLRITDTNGYGYYSLMAKGLTYAADNGARVANISFSGVPGSATVQSAAQYMKNKNGLVVVSGGNTGTLENFAITSAMIPVSATDTNDAIKSWSSYGDYIALAAPGSKIWSTINNSNYGIVSGTSYASPVVAGVIALMMAANSKLNGSEIENLLFSSAVDLGAMGRDPYYGYGRVDAAAAVQAAKEAMPAQDTEAPVVSIVDPLEGETVNGIVPVDIEAIDNVGVTRAELWINKTSVAVDTTSPFAFSWDSYGAQNGMNNLEVRVFDAAGNTAVSSIGINVDNPLPPPVMDTEPPVVQIINPVAGNVSGNVVINVNASDNANTSEISLSVYINGILKTTGMGSTLSTNWNTRAKGTKTGTHTLQAIAKDAAGNTSTTSIKVNVVK